MIDCVGWVLSIDLQAFPGILSVLEFLFKIFTPQNHQCYAKELMGDNTSSKLFTGSEMSLGC